MNLTISAGLKRLIASWVNTILGIVRMIPQAAFLIGPLEALAALFGAVGVVHGVVARTVSQNALATVSAILSVLIMVAHWVPALVPFVPYLEQLATIIGAMVVSQTGVVMMRLRSGSYK